MQPHAARRQEPQIKASGQTHQMRDLPPMQQADPVLMATLFEHCDRCTDRIMREVVANLAVDPTLANPATQNVLIMDVQTWNCFWAQIVAGYANLGIQVANIQKPLPTTPAQPTTPSTSTQPSASTTTTAPVPKNACAIF